jgi:pimeloyl-ACP methyl ester carboxylesterase
LSGIERFSGMQIALVSSMPTTVTRRLQLVGAALAIIVGSAAGKPPVSKSVTVNGARLEYLDWGGKGPPLLFLAGLGGTAHIFGDLAPQFLASHRCIGLTRRGFGQSQQTAGGYDLDNLVEDIVAFGRHAGLQDITLVAHSYGGVEAVRAAELHPELNRRVVLLDTAYDPIPSAVPPAETKLCAAFTGMTPSDQLSSLDSFRKYEQLLMRAWSPAAESNLLETTIVNNDGTVQGRTPGWISSAIVSERSQGKWRATKIPGPALLIFAQHSWADLLSGLHLDDATTAEILKAGAELQAARRSQIEAFRRDSPLARIVELANTEHHCFIQRPERVVEEMRKFLADTRATH